MKNEAKHKQFLEEREKDLKVAVGAKDKELSALSATEKKLQKTLDALKDDTEVKASVKTDRDSLKGAYDQHLQNQKELYEENVELIDELRKLDIDVIELNGIVELLQEQNEFERKGKDLTDMVRELQDGLKGVDDGADGLTSRIHQLQDVTGGKAMPDELAAIEKRIEALKHKTATEEQGAQGLAAQVEAQVDRLRTKPVEELEQAEVQDGIDQLEKTEKQLQKALREKDALQAEQDKIANDLGKLELAMKKKLSDDLKNRVGVAGADTKKVGESAAKGEEALKGLAAKVKKKGEGLDEADKKMRLDHLAKKIAEAQDLAKALGKDNDATAKNAESVGDALKPLKPDMSNAQVPYLVGQSNAMEPTEAQIAKNKERAGELDKLVKDIDGELDEFDRSARQERLDAAKGKAREKLAALQGIAEKIR